MGNIFIPIGVIFSIVMLLFFIASCRLSSIESRKEEVRELAKVKSKYRKEII